MEIALKDALGVTVLGNREEYFELFKVISKDPLIDRLYRRYVRHEDISYTLEALDNCLICASKSDKQKILKIKSSLLEGNKASELCIKDYGKYIPVHIILFDMPYSVLSRNIPIDDYDNLEGEPFWMRPQYILEHYSQTYGNYKYKD